MPVSCEASTQSRTVFSDPACCLSELCSSIRSRIRYATLWCSASVLSLRVLNLIEKKGFAAARAAPRIYPQQNHRFLWLPFTTNQTFSQSSQGSAASACRIAVHGRKVRRVTLHFFEKTKKQSVACSTVDVCTCSLLETARICS